MSHTMSMARRCTSKKLNHICSTLWYMIEDIFQFCTTTSKRKGVRRWGVGNWKGSYYCTKKEFPNVLPSKEVNNHQFKKIGCKKLFFSCCVITVQLDSGAVKVVEDSPSEKLLTICHRDNHVSHLKLNV